MIPQLKASISLRKIEAKSMPLGGNSKKHGKAFLTIDEKIKKFQKRLDNERDASTQKKPQNNDLIPIGPVPVNPQETDYIRAACYQQMLDDIMKNDYAPGFGASGGSNDKVRKIMKQYEASFNKDVSAARKQRRHRESLSLVKIRSPLNKQHTLTSPLTKELSRKIIGKKLTTADLVNIGNDLDDPNTGTIDNVKHSNEPKNSARITPSRFKGVQLQIAPSAIFQYRGSALQPSFKSTLPKTIGCFPVKKSKVDASPQILGRDRLFLPNVPKSHSKVAAKK